MPSAKIELRRATVSDLHDLIELELSDMPVEPDAAVKAAEVQCDRLERQERNEIALFVAERKGDIIGQLVLRWPDRPDRFGRTDREAFADIEDARVLPAYRRGGVGAELVTHAEWHCMRDGIDRIGAAVRPATQQRAAAWLESMGYEPTRARADREEWVDWVKEF